MKIPSRLSPLQFLKHDGPSPLSFLLLYLAHTLRQPGQTCKPAILFFEPLDRARWRAPDGLSPANDFPARNACLSAGDTTCFQPAVIRNTHLTSDHYIALDHGGSRNSGLGRHQRSLADLNVVCQMHEIIQFHL